MYIGSTIISLSDLLTEYGEDETAENKRKGHTSTLGRFFKNVGIRRSGRRYTYKKHQGEGSKARCAREAVWYRL